MQYLIGLAVESKPLGSYLSRAQRMALFLVLGANILVWSALATLGAHGASAPPARPTFASTVPLLPSPTRTPFMPLVVDVTALPTSTLTPTPTLEGGGVATLPLGEDTLVVALLGVDQQRMSSVWRTDSIVLAFIEQGAKRVSLLSVPRDLWVYIPDHGYDRINTVDALGERSDSPGGGLALLDHTFRHNLGLPVDHYVRMDFYGFVRIVDALGGVTVNVEQPIEDAFPDSLSPTGLFHMDLSAGPRHMDGHMALCYCRSRMTTSDYDRSRRQRQVLLALWQQAFTLEALTQAPQLWATLRDAFETDLTMAEAIRLAQLVYGIEPHNVRSQSLDAATVKPWTMPQGAEVLLPQADAIRQAILDLLSPQAQDAPVRYSFWGQPQDARGNESGRYVNAKMGLTPHGEKDGFTDMDGT